MNTYSFFLLSFRSTKDLFSEGNNQSNNLQTGGPGFKSEQMQKLKFCGKLFSMDEIVLHFISFISHP
jgi:hypothetical protein